MTDRNVWVRNIVRASRVSPPCAYLGDSGGSVFVTANGGVTAVGTYSGFYGTIEPPPDGACGIVFTDIYNSFNGLPGNPLTPPGRGGPRPGAVERIVVRGPEFVGARLTPEAYSLGLALALPERVQPAQEWVLARPTGFEPADATVIVKVPIAPRPW